VFTRVLVANRGEIAVRIIKTLRKLAVRSVLAAAVPDRHSLAARMADEVVLLEGSRPDETYLHVERIMSAADSGGCQAIHPGYGFLSESPLLAAACNAAGITFIGPSVDVLRTLGDKTAARELAVQNDIPVVPGWDGEGAGDELTEQVARIRYPLMVKARGGGGGRGMRRVDTEAELQEALASAKREAESAFGDERVFIEKYVTDAHHVEVQVLADQHGAMIHLGERDCSVQRRHQKLIEETPSPIVDDALRDELTEAALKLMRVAGYVNAGTVEFLVGPEDGGRRPFYFIEVNPRLQVEHTVTEEVTGLDLVELQLRIASGEPLPFAQDEVEFNGHAIEFRINAEDPYEDFRPSSGRITDFGVANIYQTRFDSGFEPGDSLTLQYDSLLGKLILSGSTRHAVIADAGGMLSPRDVEGVASNIALHSAVCRDDTFRSGEATTTWLESALERLLSPAEADEGRWAAAAIGILFGRHSFGTGSTPDRWIGAGETSISLSDGQQTRQVTLRFDGPSSGRATLGDRSMPFRTGRGDETMVGTPPINYRVSLSLGTGIAVYDNDQHSEFFIAPPPPLPRRTKAATTGSLVVSAPLSGTIGVISVEAGQAVEAGDLLLVLEAMKMEHRVTAPSKGAVSELHVETGQVVSEGDELVVLGEPPD
jgi:acetyl/propionyl-CoA carboxylase alpha subunit